MPYYETLEEDIKRAKEILAEGKAEPFMLGESLQLPDGGTIYGKDIYAAYKLLESFVAELERLHGRAVAQQAERAAQLKEAERIMREGWTPITTKAEFEARYGDRDAADKIQRGVMYLDIGYLVGTIDNLLTHG